MKRALAGLLTAAVAGAGVVAVPTTAHADTPGCVSYYEYSRIRQGLTYAQVNSLLDTAGYQIYRYDGGYWDVEWVEDGYWDAYVVDDGYYDGSGNWIDTSYLEPYWVDLSYTRDVWVSLVDTVRSYKKCRGFDRGRGRVGINFDNYTSTRTGMRVFKKIRNNPYAIFGRGSDPLVGKSRPDAGATPPKPEPTPTSPKPERTAAPGSAYQG